MSELDVYYYDDRGYQFSLTIVGKEKQKHVDKYDLYVELEAYEELKKSYLLKIDEAYDQGHSDASEELAT